MNGNNNQNLFKNPGYNAYGLYTDGNTNSLPFSMNKNAVNWEQAQNSNMFFGNPQNTNPGEGNLKNQAELHNLGGITNMGSMPVPHGMKTNHPVGLFPTQSQNPWTEQAAGQGHLNIGTQYEQMSNLANGIQNLNINHGGLSAFHDHGPQGKKNGVNLNSYFNLMGNPGQASSPTGQHADLAKQGMRNVNYGSHAMPNVVNTRSIFSRNGSLDSDQAAAKAAAEIPVAEFLSQNKGHVYEHDGKYIEIRNVWKSNLQDEMKIIREVVRKYNFIAMDTEFPGVVARPCGPFKESHDYSYQTLRCNVDLLNLIQLGIAFTDGEGNWATVDERSIFHKRKNVYDVLDISEPEGKSSEDHHLCCWQFHFKFSLTDDMYAQDSIDLLKSSGIDFNLHEQFGIDIDDFAELLVVSGLVLMPEVNWISFHGSYDFGYLFKLLTSKPLPATEKEFLEALKIYFPNIFDVKYMMKKVKLTAKSGPSSPRGEEKSNVAAESDIEFYFQGGLQRLAELVGAERVGPMHQAGSDAMLTSAVFFEIVKQHFSGDHGEKLFSDAKGLIHGLGDAAAVRMMRSYGQSSYYPPASPNLGFAADPVVGSRVSSPNGGTETARAIS